MDFFEKIENIGMGGKKTPAEKAGQILARLATVISEAPDLADLETGNYLNLFTMRVEKAKRAYEKAKNALANDHWQASGEHSQRGLLHYELAAIHAYTEATPLVANTNFVRTFSDGDSEILIEKLQDGICRIKLLIEYQNISLSKELRLLLSNSVQILQDAIECYAHDDQYDLATVCDTATGGLIWCQYIYAALGTDSLYSPKSESKTQRGLYQLALDAGIAAYKQFGSKVAGARAKIDALENFLQSALNSYMEGKTASSENFVRLGIIEAITLQKEAQRFAEGRGLPPTGAANQSTPSPKLKQVAAELAELFERHSPRPARALRAIERLRAHVTSLKRAMRAEAWREAHGFLRHSRRQIVILAEEVAKMNNMSA